VKFLAASRYQDLSASARWDLQQFCEERACRKWGRCWEQGTATVCLGEFARGRGVGVPSGKPVGARMKKSLFR